MCIRDSFKNFNEQPTSPRHREPSRLQAPRAACWYSSGQGDKQGHRQAFVSDYLAMDSTSGNINLVFPTCKATASLARGFHHRTIARHFTNERLRGIWHRSFRHHRQHQAGQGLSTAFTCNSYTSSSQQRGITIAQRYNTTRKGKHRRLLVHQTPAQRQRRQHVHEGYGQ